ncbi:MAG: FAD-binding oxidoreductase [Polyangiales bacterium]
MSDSPVSRPTAIDVLAAAVARVTPRALHPRIDAVRLDLRQMLRSFTADNTRPFASTQQPFEAPPALDEISVLDAVLPKPLAERVDAVRRDVLAMTRGVRNEKPVVTIETRPPAEVISIAQEPAAEPAVARSVHPRSVRVIEVRKETADATTFVLEEPSDAPPAHFQPGQFVTVVVTINGEPHRRAYSISSTLDELPRYAITVKRVRGGLVSNHLNDAVREGDSLSVLGPSGSFVLQTPAPSRVWLFAGGSGITPVYSILRAVLAQPDGPSATLVYANRTKDSVIFRAAIDALVAQHPERFSLVSVLEESDPYAQVTGRLDADNCAAVCEVIEVPADAHCYLCGPEPMMDAVRATLVARGIDKDHIHEERFTSPQKRTHEAPVSRGGHALEIRQGRSSKKLTTRPDQTILEAGLEAGIDMPFSCTMGGCGACKLKLVSGTVDVVEPNCLLESEKAEGAILACVGCTTSDAVVEVP